MTRTTGKEIRTPIEIQPVIDVIEVAQELKENVSAFGDTKNKAKENAVFYLLSQFERIAYLEQQVRELLEELAQAKKGGV